jgi:threonine dehydratase
MLCVDTDAICAAIKDVFEDTRSILEPAGALAVAGMKADVARRGRQGQTLVAVACGANMNFDRLRFVAERTEISEDREAMLAVEIPERAGSLREFCTLLGQRNLTEFSYRLADPGRAHIFVGVQTSGSSDEQNLIHDLQQAGFPCLDLSNDELSKLHLRHMVGGRMPAGAGEASGHGRELLYRFEFPERPGALMRFLTSLHPNWNISIFHYRNHGADVGRIVVGVQVPPQDMGDWQDFLQGLGYQWVDETDNPAYRLFLGELAGAVGVG